MELIDKLLLEAARLASFTDYEIPEDDPAGWMLTIGWITGLNRAVEMLQGGEPLEYEEIEDRAQTLL